MAQHRLGRVVTSSLLRRFEGTQLRPTVHRRFTPIVKCVAETDTMGSVTIRVFLLDDHEMVRAGVRSVNAQNQQKVLIPSVRNPLPCESSD
jgi:hypothetical protein